MEIYTSSSASSFETSLTLQPRNTFRDVSFSSYLNNAEENMIRKLTNQVPDTQKDHHFPNRKKPQEEEEEEDEEIGVFGAEKYFKGEIEDGDGKNDPRFLDKSNSTTKIHHQDQRIQEFNHSFQVKQRNDQISMHTPSVRSNASLNSRSGLLPHPKQTPRKPEKESKTKILLSRFGCNCIDKKSTQISEKRFIQAKEISKPHPKIFDFDQVTDPLSSYKSVENNTRNDYFSFPVLNSNDTNSISSLNSKSGNLAGKVHIDNNGGRLTLGRKLSLLNDWDVDIPTEDEMCIPSNGIYKNDNDIDSDSSSDLFEIESFSTAGNSSFLAHRTSESNCYAPSEVSIDWSVVTASAADFSVASDYEDMRTGGGGGGGGWRNSGGDRKDEQKKRPGILSGCTNHKAVRVAGDEYKVSGGGGRRRLSESMAIGGMFRGVKNVTRFDRNYGSDVCPIPESKGRHASHHLYIQ